MKYSTQYIPYNPSWGKFVGSIIASMVLTSVGVVKAELPPELCLKASAATYFAHNLYSHCRYNTDLTKKLKVHLHGEDHIRFVKIQPSFLDTRTIFDIFGFTSAAIAMAQNLCSSSSDLETSFDNILLLLKLFHMFSPNTQEFTFTDLNTNEVLPPDNISSITFEQ